MPTVSLDPKVFINESADGNKYPSFRFQRVYKNAEGKDEYTNSFSGKDLPSLAMAASRAKDYEVELRQQLYQGQSR